MNPMMRSITLLTKEKGANGAQVSPPKGSRSRSNIAYFGRDCKILEAAPHDFLADGDKVVVLTTAQLGGEALESADVLTYNDAGKLVAFDTIGDPTIANRVFAS